MTALLNSRNELMWPFQQRFDKLFDSLFNNDSLNTIKSLSKSGYPKIDAYHEGNQYKIQALIPGVKLEDLKVEISPETINGIEYKILKIGAKMSEDYQLPDNANHVIREIRRSSFERILSLPHDLDDPEAILKDGVLTLIWNLKEEFTSQPKLITVKTS